MVKRPSIAAIIWFLAFFVVSTILLRSLWVTSDEPSDVIFDNKVFYDFWADRGWRWGCLNFG